MLKVCRRCRKTDLSADKRRPLFGAAIIMR